jgi:glycosyltransferase involved in cell wall biosynthesis
MPKTILLCSNIYPPYSVGGAELIASYHAKTLLQMGHKPIVFAGCDDPRRPHYTVYKDSVDGVSVYRIQLANADFDAHLVNFFHPEIDRQFEILLQKHRPSVVHMHNIIGLSAGMIRAAKAHGARVVITLHDFWGICFKNTLIDVEQKICDNFSRCRDCQKEFRDGLRTLPIRMRNDFLALQFAEVDAFISPSQYLANMYIKAGIPPHKMHVIWNGLDVDRFAGIVKKPSNGKVRFSFIGYLGEHKGVIIILDAIMLLKDYPALHMNVVGDGHLRAHLEQQVQKRGLSDKVRFWGKVPHSEIERVFSETDIQLLPSVWPENQPVSITESMASRTPVIATRLGGIPELVRDGQTGYLIDPSSPAALVNAMQHFLQFPEDIPAFGERAGQVISGNTFANQVQRILELYEQIG